MEETSQTFEFNPFEPSFWAEPYRFYPSLLIGPPRRLPLFIPTVAVARYRDAFTVLRAPTCFSSCLPQLPFISKFNPFDATPTMLLSDPPEHARLRRLAMHYFRPDRIEELAGRIRELTDALLDTIAAMGEFDAVADFAAPLPVAINAEILGVSKDDHAMLKAWSDEIFGSARRSLMIAGASLNGKTSGSPQVGAAGEDADSLIGAIDSSIPPSTADAMAAMRDYFMHLIIRRRVRVGNDLISTLIPAHDDGALTTDELLAMIELILFAGSETTSGLIANGLLALSIHSDQLELVRSRPELIPSAIEEILRYDSPVQMIMRFSLVDTTIAGTKVPKGAVVLVMLGAANRDPDHFIRPECFDVLRRPNEHVAFGDGIHSCMGAQLARLQGKIAIGAILARFPEFRRRDPRAPLVYSGSLLSRGLSSLPMVVS